MFEWGSNKKSYCILGIVWSSVFFSGMTHLLRSDCRHNRPKSDYSARVWLKSKMFFSVTVWAAQITSILILLLFFLYNADFGSLSYATVIQEFTLRHSLVWTESCSKSLLKDTLRGVVVQSILEFLKFWIKSVSVKPFTSQSYRSWLRLRLHTGLRTEIKTFLLQKRET